MFYLWRNCVEQCWQQYDPSFANHVFNKCGPVEVADKTLPLGICGQYWSKSSAQGPKIEVDTTKHQTSAHGEGAAGTLIHEYIHCVRDPDTGHTGSPNPDAIAASVAGGKVVVGPDGQQKEFGGNCGKKCKSRLDNYLAKCKGGATPVPCNKQ
jgi:hypothetical protein